MPKFYNALPADWQAIITPCTKWTDNTGAKSTAEENVTETTDNLWLLSEFEVFGSCTYSNSYEQNKQAQYDYFTNHSSIFYKHSATTTAAAWWLRSPDSTTTTSYVCSRGAAAESLNKAARYSYGIVPCFAVGGD